MNFLYHGSWLGGLRFLLPQKRNVRSERDPPRIYAAPTKVVAAAFMIVELNDSWSAHGSYDGGKTWHLVVADQARFCHLEAFGGSIYTVPTTGFQYDHVGLGRCEWYSRYPTRVIAEESCDSVLLAMLMHGLRVYFCDADAFAAFKSLSHKCRAALLDRSTCQLDGTYRFPTREVRPL